MTEFFSDTLNVLTDIGTVHELPFPWGSTPSCLPADVYLALAKCRPNLKINEPHNNKRFDLRAHHMLKDKELNPIWRNFIEYHTSTGFYHKILDRFETHFVDFYQQLNGMRDYKVGVRFQGEADIYLDCQLSVNTPVSEKCTVAPPHVDNPLSLWASLLYMKENDDDAGGDLILYKSVRPPVLDKNRHANSEHIRPYVQIPYAANTYACFINSPLSIHSVAERNVTDKQRLMVNITLEFGSNRQQLFQVQK